MKNTITEDNTIELTPERENAIDKYISYQEDFKKLNAKWILTSFKITTHHYQNELDIDSLTEEQLKELKEAERDWEKHKALVKTMPHHDQIYYNDKFMLAPYYIWDAWAHKDSCLDALETGEIDLINERLSIKIETYQKYLTK